MGHVRPAKIQISLRIRAIWADVQAYLCLRLAHVAEGTFSHVTGHIVRFGLRHDGGCKLQLKWKDNKFWLILFCAPLMETKYI